jgi:hypothetical protein
MACGRRAVPKLAIAARYAGLAAPPGGLSLQIPA